MCNIAGPLSDAVLTAMVPQSLHQMTLGSASPPRPVYLMRQRGCADVVTQLTRELRVDASLEVWRVVMSGELARASAMRGVWLPSVTAWRFQSGYVPNYALEFSWPPNRPVVQWQSRRHTNAVEERVTIASTQDAAHRCSLLSKRLYMSNALAAIQQALPPALGPELLVREIGRAFPQLRTSANSVQATLARLILYFQSNRSRMREADADAFGVFFLALGVSELVSRNLPPQYTPTHGDNEKSPCTCSGLASFLSTYSNRIRLPAPMAGQSVAGGGVDDDIIDDLQDTDATWMRSRQPLNKSTEQWQQKVAAFTGVGNGGRGVDRRTRTRIEASYAAFVLITQIRTSKVTLRT